MTRQRYTCDAIGDWRRLQMKFLFDEWYVQRVAFMLQPIMLIFIVTKFIVAASLLISAKLVVAFTKTPVPRLMVERQITTVIMASINQVFPQGNDLLRLKKNWISRLGYIRFRKAQ